MATEKIPCNCICHKEGNDFMHTLPCCDNGFREVRNSLALSIYYDKVFSNNKSENKKFSLNLSDPQRDLIIEIMEEYAEAVKNKNI